MIMISAKEARKQTENYKTIQELHNNIERNINKAIRDGKFCTQVSFDCELPDSIREEIRNELESLGYKVFIHKYEKMPDGCPVDQWKMWDQLLVSWTEITT